ncbi:hypothetical protein CEXT_597161 [Caerostris extrusa]|uniref:Uncharacterized protein n=1 Tax=Caerostris extrusa TaxID=172846 RepID=A0AAV4U8N1_CAEEX|nr:hypothetical protein CEXT_597161 [Caerostris extrusa]
MRCGVVARRLITSRFTPKRLAAASHVMGQATHPFLNRAAGQIRPGRVGSETRAGRARIYLLFEMGGRDCQETRLPFSFPKRAWTSHFLPPSLPPLGLTNKTHYVIARHSTQINSFHNKLSL